MWKVSCRETFLIKRIVPVARYKKKILVNDVFLCHLKEEST